MDSEGRRATGDIEATVEVPDQLLSEVADLVVPNLSTWVADHHHTDLLRVQTLDFYGVASDGDDFHRYMAGAAEPATPGKQAWLKKLRDDANQGRIRRNVHVVREPLTDYLRYQFEWGYVYNVKAGQDVRVLAVEDTAAARHLFHVGDFNVVEHKDVARLRYGADGAFLGAVQVGADAADGYAALAELAWELATPFTAWWTQRPHYHRATRAA